MTSYVFHRIPVRLNMSLPKIKCEFVGIDIQDDMGRHEVGFVENTVKTPIGIDEEGCLFEARFHVNKVRRVVPHGEGDQIIRSTVHVVGYMNRSRNA